MKKTMGLLALLIGLISPVIAESSYYAGSGGEGHTIMFASSTIENGMYDKSDYWVTTRIRDNLISGLTRYGGFSCIDMQEARNILKIQQQLESVMYDDSQTVEIGKMIKAKEAVVIKTTRLPSGTYTLSVRLLNIETGKILTMYTSPTAYEGAESYTEQAHYDCLLFLLGKLKVKLTSTGKHALEKEQSTAAAQAERNKQLSLVNSEQNAMLDEKTRKAKEEEIAREAASQAAAEKAAKEKKAREAAAKAAAEKKNPFAYKTYVTEIENGKHWDTYKIAFISQNECSITVTSEDATGKKSSITKNGSYAYENEILTVTANMRNTEVKHVQAIHWKSMVSFKNGYNTLYIQIPIGSSKNAKQVRAEFSKH